MQLMGFNIEAEGGELAALRHFVQVREALMRAGWCWPEQLYYYGPALHSLENRRSVEEVLRRVFPEIGEIEVAHDLLAAARAAWGRGEGIVCILGTGSNCAQYDGAKLIRQRGGHGYLLGDEGSGADLGRHLLSALLHEELPPELLEAFEVQYSHSSLELRAEMYRASRPSAYLASFAPFLSGQKQHPWVRALVRSRFEAFIRRTWGRWVPVGPVRYVGGVARAFSDLLEEVTRAAGGVWGGVMMDPAEGLLQFHLT